VSRRLGRWAIVLGAAILMACGAGGEKPSAAATPAIKVDIGANASVDDIAYVAAERVGFDRLPKARMEPADEVRIEVLVRRVPAFRLKDNPKAALRYTEDGTRGWLVWQPVAVLFARRELARREHFPVNQIQTVDVLHETWTDGCLGAGRPGESCTEAVVPGFRVLLRLAGKSFEVHTDQKERAVVAAS
jgi:hypothetical protein